MKTGNVEWHWHHENRRIFIFFQEIKAFLVYSAEVRKAGSREADKYASGKEGKRRSKQAEKLKDK